MEETTPEVIDDDFDDPKHLKSIHNPCSWCRARWVTPPHARYDHIDHNLPCAYLEHQEYGGGVEMKTFT